MFVVVCAWLQKCFGFSLPGSSLFFHAVTTILTALMSLLSIEFFFPLIEVATASAISIWAVIIYTFCPIVSFSSQKVWIDNCAAATVTLSAVIHLIAAIKSRGIAASTSTSKILVRAQIAAMHLISGFVFGGFALNTKISNLALVPFLLGVSVIASFGHAQEGGKSHRNFQDICTTVVVSFISFMAGISFGHGPWVFYYWVRPCVNLFAQCYNFSSHIYRFLPGESCRMLGRLRQCLQTPYSSKWR